MKNNLRLLAVQITSMAFSVNAFAANYQNYDLEKFLQEFAADSAKVLEQAPPKIDHQPLRNVNPFTPEAVESRRFVTVKDQQRKDYCKTVDGVKVCLSDLAGRAAIQSNDLASELVDNSATVVSTLEEMESKNLLQGRLTTQPWSDDYWAIAKGILGARYADPDKGNTLDWKEAVGFVEANPAQNYVEKNEQNLLSPSEKYDLLVGDKNATMTKAMWKEGQDYYESTGSVEIWMGICHGWAPAAYMLQRPKHSVETVAADGTKITFYPADIKALGSLLWAKNSTETRFVGGRCDVKDPRKDENGRVVEQQCFDSNPGTWHQVVVNQIGISNRSFVMDATYDYQVWNQPVVSYSYSYFNPQTKRAVNTIGEAKVSRGAFTSDVFKRYRSPLAKSVVGIQMEVEYMMETSPEPRNTDSAEMDASTTAIYRYDLELDQYGKIIGGEWYSNVHPDFLWTPVKNAKARSQADRYTTERWTRGAKVPAQWQKVAPYASAAGIPLARLVEELFKQAQ